MYKLNKIDENTWMCSDITNNIVCTWKDKMFNSTNKVTELYDESSDIPPVELARLVNDMTKWLIENHKGILSLDYRLVVGQRIQEYRLAAGLTQAELADKAGMRRPHISRIEAGRYNLTIDTLSAVAEALGKKVDIIDI